MATVLTGTRSLRGSVDDDGYREYKIVHMIKAGRLDGPANVLQTPGLPLPGSMWAISDDLDVWVWCRPNAIATIHEEKEGDPSRWWTVEQTFSNKPLSRDKQRCHDVQTEDPLLEPPKISGGAVTYTEEATRDRFGSEILTSSFEQIRGPQVEFDAGRPTVRIEMNVPTLNYALLASMKDTVNDGFMWGLPRRCIKLSNFTWERVFHGQCYLYYRLSLEFEINYETFDRNLPDEGTMALSGRYNSDGEYQLISLPTTTPGVFVTPNRFNPTHFVKYKDRHGELARVMLNGAGLPVGSIISGSVTSVGAAPCCVEDVPTQLRATITNKVGSATCLPDTIMMDYDPVNNEWVGWYDDCEDLRDGGDRYFTMGCDPNWYGNPAVRFGFGGVCAKDMTIVSLTCSPFQAVYDMVLGSGAPGGGDATCGAGTFRVTVDDVIVTTIPGLIHVEKYLESNFFLLGIPTFF